MLAAADHRQIGQKLDLFHFQEAAPGMVFWHPRGFFALTELRNALARVAEADGFEQVQTPQILRQEVWEMSGHVQHYRDGMFAVGDEDCQAFVKPVSCPGHLEIFRRRAASYRDLPLRLAEFGLVHRGEPSGTLHGLFRLRQFTQDDGHVFCAEDQVESEVSRFCRSLRKCYSRLGFERVKVAFATRPAERAGSDASWDAAERMLASAARAASLSPEHAPGAGAFYGPKLEFSLEDHGGRSWQCGTIQLDLVLPERFDVSYMAASGRKSRPAMLHRAVLGSLERFLGILLEQSTLRLPPWLNQEQARLLPVAESELPLANEILAQLRSAGVRARLAVGPESLARRVRDAHADGVPFLFLLGQRELNARAVTLRAAGAERLVPIERAVEEVRDACAAPC